MNKVLQVHNDQAETKYRTHRTSTNKNISYLLLVIAVFGYTEAELNLKKTSKRNVEIYVNIYVGSFCKQNFMPHTNNVLFF